MAEPEQNQHEPYVPAHKSLPEITVVTVVLAVLLSILLSAANAYLGLFAGMTVSASIPAAVISMAALRVIGGNILQNNAVQTSASAGESLAAGVIFTIPALVLLGVWADFHYWETTMLAGFGGVLGVLFTIPLRRALIVDQPLRFPEGVATAEVLKVGDRGGGGIRHIAIAAVVGGLFKLGTTGLKLWQQSAAVAFKVKGSVFYLGSDLSPALVAVGYIVGLNIAVLVFLGGAANWLIAIPIYAGLNDTTLFSPLEQLGFLAELARTLPLTEDPEALAGAASAMLPRSPIAEANAIWSAQTRYLGVGAMLVGGLWALIRLSPSLVQGIRSSLSAYKNVRGTQDRGIVLRTERDTPMQVVFIVAGVAVVPLFFIFHHFSGNTALSVFMAFFMVVAGFLFSAVAAYMAGLVGSSNNPISGVTIATILSAALLLKLLGTDAALGPAAAIFIGSVVCSAAAIGGDNMQDLKAGHLVGSTPRKLQIMQVIGVLAAVFFMAPVLNLLHHAYVIGSKELSAPQSTLMSLVAEGVFEGGLPWGIIGAGAAVAAAVIVLDLILEAKGSAFRTPVLAVAVGIYLPFELSVPIFLGGLLAHASRRHLERRGAAEEETTTCQRHGLLFAAGLITGEALIGILLAIPIAIAADSNVLALVAGEPMVLPGLILLGLVMYLLYRTASRTTR